MMMPIDKGLCDDCLPMQHPFLEKSYESSDPRGYPWLEDRPNPTLFDPRPLWSSDCVSWFFLTRRNPSATTKLSSCSGPLRVTWRYPRQSPLPSSPEWCQDTLLTLASLLQSINQTNNPSFFVLCAKRLWQPKSCGPNKNIGGPWALSFPSSIKSDVLALVDILVATSRRRLAENRHKLTKFNGRLSCQYCEAVEKLRYMVRIRAHLTLLRFCYL